MLYTLVMIVCLHNDCDSYAKDYNLSYDDCNLAVGQEYKTHKLSISYLSGLGGGVQLAEITIEFECKIDALE